MPNRRRRMLPFDGVHGRKENENESEEGAHAGSNSKRGVFAENGNPTLLLE